MNTAVLAPTEMIVTSSKLDFLNEASRCGVEAVVTRMGYSVSVFGTKYRYPRLTREEALMCLANAFDQWATSGQKLTRVVFSAAPVN